MTKRTPDHLLKHFKKQFILGLFFSGLIFAGVCRSAESFTYEDLVSLIESQKLTQIEDVLPFLPKDLRQSYTLIPLSLSRQGSSFLHPRVLMFGKEASLIIAFNGSDQDKGPNSNPQESNGFFDLEIIQWRPNESRFEFREISFPPSGTGKVNFSDKNPARCLECHGTAPRPIWRPYDTWPEAYGSADDYVSSNSKEEKELKNFISIRDSHPRYRSLVNDAQYPLYPYSDKSKYSAIVRPNMRLTEFLIRYNASQIVADLLSQKGFDKLKYSLFYLLMGCDNYYATDSKAKAEVELLHERRDQLHARVNEIYQISFPNRPFREETKELKQILTLIGAGFELWGLDLLQPNSDPILNGYLYNTGGILSTYFMVQEKLYAAFIPSHPKLAEYYSKKYYDNFYVPKHWTQSETEFDLAHYALLNTVGNPLDFEPFRLPNSDERKEPLRRMQACDYIYPLAKQELDAFIPVLTESPPLPKKSIGSDGRSVLLANCIGCHSGGHPIAPMISFSNEQDFKNELNRTTLHGRSLKDDIKTRISAFATKPDGELLMPPANTMTYDEIQLIKAYLETL